MSRIQPSRHIIRRLMELGVKKWNEKKEPFKLPFNGTLSADEHRMANQYTFDDQDTDLRFESEK